MNDNSVVTVQDRNYIDPNKTVQETNEFIDNLRNIQQQNNDQITQQTKALGSDVPLAHGGLEGSGSIWRDRFQAQPVNKMIQGLRATAQANALQTQLQNEMAQKQREYKLAYRAAYDREKARQKAASTRSSGSNNNSNGVQPLIDLLNSDDEQDTVTPTYEDKQSVGNMATPEDLKETYIINDWRDLRKW